MPSERDESQSPPAAQPELSIHRSAQLRVTAAAARKRVSRLVQSELGNLLYGGEPALVVGERIGWRVPVLLAFPDRGRVGQAGTSMSTSQPGPSWPPMRNWPPSPPMPPILPNVLRLAGCRHAAPLR